MPCPPKIFEVVYAILRTGLLRIRALRDADRCILEADHLHNLPSLLDDFKAEHLDYYWNVERICFIERCSPDDVRDFEPLWDSLSEYVTPSKGKAFAG